MNDQQTTTANTNDQDVSNDSEVFDMPGQQTQDDQQTQESQTTQQTSGVQTQESQPSIQDVVTQAVRGVFQAQQSQQQTPEQKQYTPEELAKLTNKFHVDKNIADAFASGEPEKVVQALQSVVDGTVKHTLTVARMLAEHQQNQIMASLQPHIEFAMQQRDIAAMQQYLSKFPKHQGFESIVDAEARRLVAENGHQGKTKEQIVEAVGKRVDAILSRMASQNGVNAPNQQQTQQTQPPKMSSLSTGGQGGAGNQGGQQVGSDGVQLTPEQRAALDAW